MPNIGEVQFSVPWDFSVIDKGLTWRGSLLILIKGSLGHRDCRQLALMLSAHTGGPSGAECKKPVLCPAHRPKFWFQAGTHTWRLPDFEQTTDPPQALVIPPELWGDKNRLPPAGWL